MLTMTMTIMMSKGRKYWKWLSRVVTMVICKVHPTTLPGEATLTHDHHHHHDHHGKFLHLFCLGGDIFNHSTFIYLPFYFYTLFLHKKIYIFPVLGWGHFRGLYHFRYANNAILAQITAADGFYSQMIGFIKCRQALKSDNQNSWKCFNNQHIFFRMIMMMMTSVMVMVVKIMLIKILKHISFNSQ